MEEFKKLVKQYWQFGLLAIVALVLLTVVSATGNNIRDAGSSYNLAANGYSDWYQMMVDRGFKIDRWQKSFPQLTQAFVDREGITLLQINSQLERLNLTPEQLDWVENGNTIVILGVKAPAWDVPFRADLDSESGKIRIETSRRFIPQSIEIAPSLQLPERAISNDRAGNAIVEFQLDGGRIIIATTSYLAANAYQDFRSNYDLLADLVSQDRQQILVDEYIHGYIDRSATAEQKKGDVLGYLARTPLSIILLNLVLGILVLIWQQNRRFGKVFIPKPPEIENSTAYIQALGGVLNQANSSEFVVQNIGKAEQLSWQKKLGLGGEQLVEMQILITAWEDRVQLPTEDLRFVLKLMSASRRLTPNELSVWLTKIQSIDKQIEKL